MPECSRSICPASSNLYSVLFDGSFSIHRLRLLVPTMSIGLTEGNLEVTDEHLVNRDRFRNAGLLQVKKRDSLRPALGTGPIFGTGPVRL